MDQPSGETTLSRRRVMEAALATSTALAWPRAGHASLANPLPDRETPFDGDWRFLRGDAEGAARPDFDDSGWRKLDLPHDWSIEDVPGAQTTPQPWAAPAALWSETARRALRPGEMVVFPEIPPPGPGAPPRPIGPFDPDNSPAKQFSGWTVGGVGWYRKRFVGAGFAPDEVVELRFDGVFKDAQIWLNGKKLASHDHGFSGFAVDLTPSLQRDGANVLAVRVANQGLNSRWYSGSGIYRHVWLTRTGPVRVPLWGVLVTTPQVSADKAAVHVAVEVENRTSQAAPVTLVLTLRDDAGRTMGQARHALQAPASGRETTNLIADIAAPRRWSPSEPTMYEAEVVVECAGRTTDRTVTPFGVRTLAVDARKGLTVNDVPIKLHGACLHADNGLLGAAAFERAERRKVGILKANGFNAIRCSHNLYSPAFMDACDELGMIVFDETFDVWNEGKFGADLGAAHFKQHWREDVADMVRRDRNHPSVFFWSLGNEIPERNAPLGVETAAALRKAVLDLDDTRLITAALAPMVSGKEAEPSRRSLDVVGYNYMSDAYEADHAANPDTVFMGTEQYAAAMHDVWRKVERYPWLIGDFVWSGLDYLGEAGCGSSQLRRDGEKAPPGLFPFVGFLWDYPAFLSGSGEIDILGRKKPASHYRDVLWRRSDLELFVQRPTPKGFHEELGDWAWHDELESWTWPHADEMIVRAYTNGDEVRLLLNGREVGRKRLGPQDKLIAQFKVRYEAGELVAVALRQGMEIGRKALTTVGAPAKLRLTPEGDGRVSRRGGDLGYVLVEVCDAQDRLVPDAQRRLTVTVAGPARLVTVGAANPRGVESLRDNVCTTFHGVAQAILAPGRDAGTATLQISSPGLAPARADLTIA